MEINDIIREMHGDIKTLKMDGRNTKDTVTEMREMMIDGKCPTGRSNKTLILWLWGFVLGGGAGLLGLILSLHI